MRILLAALAGAIAMFIWSTIAHMATPLATTGFSQMTNESAAMQTMTSGNVGAKTGLYIFPWTDPNDPKMMEKYTALAKTHPTGLLLYRPVGQDMDAGNMTPMLIKEFIKQFVQALIAAWIVSMIVASFMTRTVIVTAMAYRLLSRPMCRTGTGMGFRSITR
ncbi:MAG: hypothetical protein WDM89_08675 [Rhizomicrobium sp.]